MTEIQRRSPDKSSGRLGARAWLRLPALVLPLVLLASCAEEEELIIGPVEGFAGLVSADEPRAALIGRDILANGGNAVDAAVAMYFAMAVTLPSRASLGGGGVCIAFDSSEARADLVEFVPRAGSGDGVLPRGVRAMAALHARQGLERWETLVSPAENLARFGNATSRAFARDLAGARAAILTNPEMLRLFRSKSGGLPEEGDRIEQIELSTVLTGIRSQGASYFYGGPFTRQFAAAAGAAGQAVDPIELRDAVPRIGPPAALDLGSETLYFSLPPAANGLVAAALWRVLSDEWNYSGAGREERAHLFVEAAMRVFADRAGWLSADHGSRLAAEAILENGHLEPLLDSFDAARHTPAVGLSPAPQVLAEDPHGAGFTAGDRWGNAAACSLTMNGLFGAGRIATGTGIVLAAAGRDSRAGTLSPTVVVAGNEVAGDGHMALAASGGAVAPTALVGVMLLAILDDVVLKQAIAAPRLHHGGAPDLVLYEPAVGPDLVEALRAKGHVVRQADRLGLVNGFYCTEGLIDEDEGCEVASDPRGWGLATRVE